MRILSRYVLGAFLRMWGLIFFGFAVLYVIVDFFEKVGRFARYDATSAQVLAYFAYKMPLILYQMLPISVFLAALLAFAVLSKNQEVTAARASGVSIRRLAAPLVWASVAFAAAGFAFDQTLVPTFTDRAERIYEEQIRGRRAKDLRVREGLWSRSGPWFFHSDVYDPAAEVMDGFEAWRVEEVARVREIVQAREARWVDGRWVASDGVRRRFGPGEAFAYEPFERLEIPDLVDPAKLKVIGRDSEAMTAAELKAHIDRLRAEGQPTAALETDLHEKFAVSLTPVFTVLLAVPFGLKGSRSGGLALGVLYAVILVFGYFVLLALGVALGHAGALPPAVASWGASAIYLAMSLVFFSRVDR